MKAINFLKPICNTENIPDVFIFRYQHACDGWMQEFLEEYLLIGL
jgi:hypothetical protein